MACAQHMPTHIDMGLEAFAHGKGARHTHTHTETRIHTHITITPITLTAELVTWRQGRERPLNVCEQGPVGRYRSSLSRTGTAGIHAIFCRQRLLSRTGQPVSQPLWSRTLKPPTANRQPPTVNNTDSDSLQPSSEMQLISPRRILLLVVMCESSACTFCMYMFEPQTSHLCMGLRLTPTSHVHTHESCQRHAPFSTFIHTHTPQGAHIQMVMVMDIHTYTLCNTSCGGVHIYVAPPSTSYPPHSTPHNLLSTPVSPHLHTYTQGTHTHRRPSRGRLHVNHTVTLPRHACNLQIDLMRPSLHAWALL